MKRGLIYSAACLVAFGAMASLSSCDNREIIGVSLPNQSTSLNVGIGERVKNAFPDYNVKVQSADDSSSSQRQQIDNFITMGAKMIVLAPVEVETLTDSLLKAREAGIKIVISGANNAVEGTYDAVTVSNEFLVGNEIAYLSKKWVESKYTKSSDFDILVLKSTLSEDSIIRSNGMLAYKEQYLKNKNGQYIDIHNNVVDESQKVENPAYSELMANANTYEVEMGLNDTGRDLVANNLLIHPNIKVVLMYGSLFAAGGSQYICDNYADYSNFGIFGGGVSGNEAAYLLGSLNNGVGQTVECGGNVYKGVASCFRSAVSFGGEDAAASVSDLAIKVFTGEAGIDYESISNQTIGLWFTYADEKGEALGCLTTENETVTNFDYYTSLSDGVASIKWTNISELKNRSLI
ncbi:MAG: substrate-binding domain-containing protein [Traorella sp.]